MTTATPDESRILHIGPFAVLRASGELRGPSGVARLEPKMAELLFLLGSRPNEVFSREEIARHLWPDVVVGEDTLARLIFKLRRALDDDPKAPRFLETLPKRGYRLLLEPAAPVVLPPDAAPPATPPRRRRTLVPAALLAGAVAVALLAFLFSRGLVQPAPVALPESIASRAVDFYFQYSREDNEAAIELFERLVGTYPDYAPGHAGLANALVQRVMRWPSEPPGTTHTSLRTALADGHMRLPAARRTLERAEKLARQAVALAPEDAEAHKALGLVRSAREDPEGALAAYRRALELDGDAWGAMINLGDVLEIAGREEEALPYFEMAAAVMARVYPEQKPRVQPWYPPLASNIGDRHLKKGRLAEAAAWYRRALDFSPLHPAATRGLARVLDQQGDHQQASQLCAELRERLGSSEPCP